MEDDNTEHPAPSAPDFLLQELGSLQVELETEFGRVRAQRAISRARRKLSEYKPARGTLKQWVTAIARSGGATSGSSSGAEQRATEAPEAGRIERLDASMGLDRLAEQLHQATTPLRQLMAEHDLSNRHKLVALAVGELATLVADSARLFETDTLKDESDALKAAAVVLDGTARTLSDGLLGHRPDQLERLEELAVKCESLPLASRGYTRNRTHALSAIARQLEELIEAPDLAAEATIRYVAREVPSLPRAGFADSGRPALALAKKLRSYLEHNPRPKAPEPMTSPPVERIDTVAERRWREREWRERFSRKALSAGLEVLGATGKHRSELLAGLRQRRTREAKREEAHFAELARHLEQDPAFERLLFGTVTAPADESS